MIRCIQTLVMTNAMLRVMRSAPLLIDPPGAVFSPFQRRNGMGAVPLVPKHPGTHLHMVGSDAIRPDTGSSRPPSGCCLFCALLPDCFRA